MIGGLWNHWNLDLCWPCLCVCVQCLSILFVGKHPNPIHRHNSPPATGFFVYGILTIGFIWRQASPKVWWLDSSFHTKGHLGYIPFAITPIGGWNISKDIVTSYNCSMLVMSMFELNHLPISWSNEFPFVMRKSQWPHSGLSASMVSKGNLTIACFNSIVNSYNLPRELSNA